MREMLTEKERTFINRLYRNKKMAPYLYVMLGFFCCIALLGIVLGINYKSKDGFLLAVYLVTISAILLIKMRSDEKVLHILKKLQRLTRI